jgi:hypothetical protein
VPGGGAGAITGEEGTRSEAANRMFAGLMAAVPGWHSGVGQDVRKTEPRSGKRPVSPAPAQAKPLRG